jgi:hypothetical protein
MVIHTSVINYQQAKVFSQGLLSDLDPSVCRDGAQVKKGGDCADLDIGKPVGNKTL